MALALFAGWETLWRVQGFSPSVSDDARTWASERMRVRSDSVVLVGTSRIESGVDPRVWADSWNGRRALQLAIVGASPLVVLEQLAEDEAFAGLVLCDATTWILFNPPERTAALREEYTATYRRSRTQRSLLWETRLRSWFDAQLASQSISLEQFHRRAFVRTDASRIPYFSMTSERFLKLDFQRVDVQRRIDALLEHMHESRNSLDDAAIGAIIERVRRAVQRIRARGGEVVLLHMPHNGEIGALEREWFPRDEYWERLIAAVGDPTIHYADHAELASFVCPDGSHLDVRDAERFTRSLAGVVRKTLDRAPQRPGAPAHGESESP